MAVAPLAVPVVMHDPVTPLPSARERAASFIQAVWRGRKARKKMGASKISSLTRDFNMPRVDMTPGKMVGKSYMEIYHAFSALMLRLPLWETILIGLVVSLLTCLIFAGLFAAGGEACYFPDADNGKYFEEMLWLSVHTWSTVGYGSVFPICAGGQVLVFLQSYIVIMLNTVLMGVVLYQFLVARPRIRFSKNMLRCTASDGCPMIVFRMCRLSHDLRDLTCSVQAPFSVIKEGNVVGVVYKNLEFVGKDVPRERHDDDEVNNRLAALDQWTLYHRIDDHSPLRDDPMLRSPSLRGFSISIIAFETSYCTEARVYKTYSYKDIVHGKEFTSMTDYHPTKESPNVLRPTIDTSKIDLIEGARNVLSPQSSSPNLSPARPSAPADADGIKIGKLRKKPSW